MTRLPSLLCFIVLIVIITACGRDHSPSGNESTLYGTWIKGSNMGDTLEFLRKNNKHIIRYNLTFDPTRVTEIEYVFNNGKLQLKNYWAAASAVNPWYPVQSFAWKRVGKEFEVKGFEIFSHLSSTLVTFTYTKL
jgi:hypothetical protein